MCEYVCVCMTTFKSIIVTNAFVKLCYEGKSCFIWTRHSSLLLL